MSYIFYITDLNDGSIKGTNNEEIAKEFAASEDNFVVDTTTNEWVLSDFSRQKIEEIEEF